MFRLKGISLLVIISAMILVACQPAATPIPQEEAAPTEGSAETEAPTATEAPAVTEPPLPGATVASMPLPSDTPESISAPTEAPLQTTASVVKLTTENFDQEVLQSSESVLILFWADWSGPSRSIKPAVEEIADEYAGRVKVGELNVDDNPDLSNQYGIQQLPTLLLLNNGSEQTRIEGTTSKEEITQMLDQPQGNASNGSSSSPSSSATVIEITNENRGEEVDQSSLPVLLEFWAPWNGASVAQKPALEEIASEYAGRLKVGTVNVDDYPEISDNYAVQSLPTFLLISQGSEQARLQATGSKAEITAMLDQYLP